FQPVAGPHARRPQRDATDALPPRGGDAQDVGGPPRRPLRRPHHLPRTRRTVRRAVRRARTDCRRRTGLTILLPRRLRLRTCCPAASGKSACPLAHPSPAAYSVADRPLFSRRPTSESLYASVVRRPPHGTRPRPRRRTSPLRGRRPAEDEVRRGQADR